MFENGDFVPAFVKGSAHRWVYLILYMKREASHRYIMMYLNFLVAKSSADRCIYIKYFCYTNTKYKNIKL